MKMDREHQAVGSSPARTIAIAGMTRSGTTAFEKAFCTHRDVGFIHRLHGRFPQLDGLAALRRLFSCPRLAAPLFTFNSWLSPTEAYRICCRLHDRFRDFDLTAEDVRPGDPRRWQEFRRCLLAWQGCSVWALKFTGWTRAGYMQRVFPDIRYLWVSRNPEDVAWSNYRLQWWQKVARTNGVSTQDPVQALPFYVALAERLDMLAQQDLTRLGIPWLHVPYHRFVAEPEETLARCAEFSGLCPDRFETAFLNRLRIGRDGGPGTRRRPSGKERRLLAQGRGQGERLVLAPFRTASRIAA